MTNIFKIINYSSNIYFLLKIFRIFRICCLIFYFFNFCEGSFNNFQNVHFLSQNIFENLRFFVKNIFSIFENLKYCFWWFFLKCSRISVYLPREQLFYTQKSNPEEKIKNMSLVTKLCITSTNFRCSAHRSDSSVDQEKKTRLLYFWLMIRLNFSNRYFD